MRRLLLSAFRLEPGAVLFFGENAEQDLAKPLDGTGAGGAISGGDPGALRRRQPPLQFAAAVGQLQKPLPAVVGAAMLRDKPLPHELAQYPVQALFRDAQNAEQLADRHLRVAADEMHDPVMRPPEAVLREDRVGLRGKVPIREEQQLDALANRLVADFPAASASRFRSRLFMSAMLTYFAMSGTLRTVSRYKVANHICSDGTLGEEGPHGKLRAPVRRPRRLHLV